MSRSLHTINTPASHPHAGGGVRGWPDTTSRCVLLGCPELFISAPGVVWRWPLLCHPVQLWCGGSTSDSLTHSRWTVLCAARQEAVGASQGRSVGPRCFKSRFSVTFTAPASLSVSVVFTATTGSSVRHRGCRPAVPFTSSCSRDTSPHSAAREWRECGAPDRVSPNNGA